MAMIPDEYFSDLQLLVNQELRLPGTNTGDQSDWLAILGEHINTMILHDFNGLISLLYRLDIDENLLQQNLAAGGSDSGGIIAHMIVNRMLQKIKTRREYRRDDIIDGEDLW